MFRDNRISKLLIEAKIARQPAADSNADFGVLPRAGKIARPGHQSCPDAATLAIGIDGRPPDVKEARRVVESQAADGASVKLSHGTAGSLDVNADDCLRFL